MKASIEIITPDQAKKLLATSEGNRNLRSKVVAKYASDLKNGKWQINGEPIIISDDGHLRDGHHRLNAVIASGVPITSVVVRGISKNADTWDRGAGRTTSDNFKFAGKEPWQYSSSSVSLAKFCIIFVDGISNPTDAEVSKFQEENSEHCIFAYDIQNMGTHNKNHTTLHKKSPIVAAIFYAHKYGVPDETLIKFVKTVNSGMYDSKDELSAIVFRNYLLTNPVLTGARSRKDMFYKAQEAIYSYVAGYPRKTMFRGTVGIYSDKYKKN